jgi:hypothetical protein
LYLEIRVGSTLFNNISHSFPSHTVAGVFHQSRDCLGFLEA